MKKQRSLPTWKRITFVALAVMQVAAVSLLPLFTGHASADSTGATDFNLPARGSVPGSTSAAFATCNGYFENDVKKTIGLLNTQFYPEMSRIPYDEDETKLHDIYDSRDIVSWIGTFYGGGSGNQSDNNIDEMVFIMKHRETSNIPVIRFRKSSPPATPGNGGTYNDANGVCENGDYMMIPVATNRWRGYQLKQQNENPPDRAGMFMEFTITNQGADRTTGTLTYCSRLSGGTNQNNARDRVGCGYTLNNTVIMGVPNFTGTGGGDGQVGTIGAEWIDASTIKTVTLQGKYLGEIWKKYNWDTRVVGGTPYSFYFLDTSPAGRPTYNTAEKCDTPLPTATPCGGGGAKNCVPFIAVKQQLNVSHDDQGLNRLKRDISQLPTAQARIYDYDNNCNSVPAPGVNLNGGAEGLVWLYYSATNDMFRPVWVSGDGNERIYLGQYEKVSAGTYKGGLTGCEAFIYGTPGPVTIPGNNGPPSVSQIFTVEWALRDAACAGIEYGKVTVAAIGGTVGETKFDEVGTGQPDAGEIGDGKASADLVCDFSFNPLTWIMCPIISGAQAAIEQLDNAINSLLAINVDKYFDENCTTAECSGSGFYKAWNNVRKLAVAVIVIAALIMVISQAAGLELLDAYTIKKILPRMLIAVIGVSLSWELCKELIRLSEVVALGLRDIIYSPFATQGSLHIGSGTSTALALVGGASLLTLGIFAMLSFVVTAFIAVLVAFAVLVFRQAAIIFLVVLSPFAIACSILPGTQKAWKFWWSSFSAMLLMFVIIVGMISTGRVFAFVSHKADPNNLFFQLVALIAYFVPYFMITTAFKIAGGAISAVSGFVGNATSGISGGLRNFRSNAARTNIGKMRTGDRFKGNNQLSRAFNRTTQGVGFGWRGRFGLGNRGAAMRDIQGRAAADKAGKSEEMQQLQFDDDAIAAMYLSAGESSRMARRELRRLNPGWSDQRVNRAVAMAQAVGINKSNAVAAGSLAADNKFRSLGFGQAASDAIASTNARIAGGSLNAAGNFVGGNRQMFDNLEGGIRWHARTHGATHVAARNLADSWDRTNMQELNGSTAEAKRAFLDDITARLGSADVATRHRASVQMLEMHTLLSHGTDAASQQALVAAEEAIGYNGLAGGPTLTGPVAAGTTWRQHRSFEEYLGQNVMGQRQGYGVGIRSEARTWDGQDQEAMARYGRPAGT